jgi:hypothetical protein
VGSYRIDLHPTTRQRTYVDISSWPFQIPLGALIPVRVENLLPACKNLGVTHITNGCYRLHPVEWNIGEAAGRSPPTAWTGSRPCSSRCSGSPWPGRTRRPLPATFTTPALPEGAELYVIATGLVAENPRAPDAFTLLAVAETGSIGFIAQNPTVYALHGSPDAPPVDIRVGEALLVQDLAFAELSAPIQVAPGSYDLDFYPTGATPGVPAASVTTPRVEAGQQYLLIATGFLTPETVDEQGSG